MRDSQAAMHPLIEPSVQDKARLYEKRKELLSLLSLLISGIYLLAFYLSGFSRDAALAVARFSMPLAVLVYLLCFIPLACMLFPLSYIRDRVLEVRFGLSSQSTKSWFMDQVKATLLGFCLGYPLLVLLFFLFTNTPHVWWLFGVCGLFIFQIMMLIIFPVLILPIFFKQNRIVDDDLLRSIKALFDKVHINIEGVFAFNLSSKTKKENAMITGLWKTRRVLLADTLLKNRTKEQLLVVLAHEIGHQSKRHILKRAGIGIASSFVLLYAVHRIMTLFPGFPEQVEAALSLFPVFMLVAGLFSFPLRTGLSAYERRTEREADRVALELTGDAGAFITLMADLANTNLAVAYPKRYRVILFYSHPPIGERIQFAQSLPTRT